MSIHPHVYELIHAEIDGVASPAQQAALREAIARDPLVHDEYRRLKGLCELLASVPAEAPHADLAPAVMRRVRAANTSAGGLLARLRHAWPGGPVAVRYAYAVAAGTVIGVLGLHIASGGSLFGPVVPEREATATLMPSTGASRLDLAPAGVHGVATLRPSDYGAAIGLDLSTGEPVELLVKFDPAQDGGRVEVSVVRTGAAVPAGSLHLSRKD
jgi:anti-sigma factor RsiW